MAKNSFPLDQFLSPQPQSEGQKTLDIKDLFKTSSFLPQENAKKEEILSEIKGEEADLKLLEKQVLEYMQDAVTKEKFRAYFQDNLHLVSFDGSRAFFTSPTPFVVTMISRDISSIEEAFHFILGKEVSVKIEVQKIENRSLSPNKDNILNTIVPSPPQQIKNESDPALMTPDPSSLENDYKFSNFVVGPKNALAHSITKTVTQDKVAVELHKASIKKIKSPFIFIHGESGLGKTHLVMAVVNEIKNALPRMKVSVKSLVHLPKEIHQATLTNSWDRLLISYTDLDILIIEDLHHLKSNMETTQNFLFEIINTLYEKKKIVIFTSQIAPKKFDHLKEGLITRFQWGPVIEIEKPDYDTRVEIIKKKAEEFDLFLSEEHIHILANAFAGDVRQIIGSLITLSAYVEMTKINLDKEAIKKILNIDSRNKEQLTVESTIEKVCDAYQVTVESLKSKSRDQKLCYPRHAAMYLIHKHFNMTYKQIGGIFGNRDHSSVISAVKKIESDLQQTECSEMTSKLININLLF